MKLLKTDGGKGHFLKEDSSYEEIDQISKDDLLRLVDLTLLEEEAEFDKYSDEAVKNQAHQIVYSRVYEKLNQLRERRAEFIDESERAYLAEYQRYKSQEDAEE